MNQKLVRALDIEGLGSVLCTIVDYKGVRYVGQSIIPGIFNQGDNCAQLNYGILESDKPITVSRNEIFLTPRGMECGSLEISIQYAILNRTIDF